MGEPETCVCGQPVPPHRKGRCSYACIRAGYMANHRPLLERKKAERKAAREAAKRKGS